MKRSLFGPLIAGIHVPAMALLKRMAAAYLFHITRNHPFVDGNKRTGAVAALVFLTLNGLECIASEAAFERVVLGVAEGKPIKAVIADFFRKHSCLA